MVGGRGEGEEFGGFEADAAVCTLGLVSLSLLE